MREYFSVSQPHVLAHRGYAATHPENSLAAFAAALDAGATHIETDVHLSKDGQVIIFHDDTYEGKPLIEWDRSGLPTHVPSILEALRALPRAKFNIDVKSAQAATPLARIINDERAHDRILLTSFSRARRKSVVAELTRPVAQSAAAAEFGPALLGAKLGWTWLVNRSLREVDSLQIPTRALGMKTITPRTMRAYHRAEVLVHVWTINEAAQMSELISLGVNGVVTDETPTAVTTLRSPAASS